MVTGSIADSTETLRITVSKPAFVMVKTMVVPGSTPTTLRPSLVVTPSWRDPCATSAPSGSVSILTSPATAAADAPRATARTARRRRMEPLLGVLRAYLARHKRARQGGAERQG